MSAVNGSINMASNLDNLARNGSTGAVLCAVHEHAEASDALTLRVRTVLLSALQQRCSNS